MKSASLIALLFLYVSIESSIQSVAPNAELKKQILDQILPKNNNDILVAPGNGSNGPTSVGVFIHILSIDKLNEEKMDFTVRILLRQTWTDYRLNYDNIKGPIMQITVLNDPNVIWTPDLFFTNEKKGHRYDITRPNGFVRISSDGSVICSQKLSITASCPMNLKHLPFDKQECTLKLEAYGSTTEDVVLFWRDYAPVTVSRAAHLPLFTLDKLVTHSGVNNINTGEYSYLALSFYLSRTLGHYILHFYMPCNMLVIISWIPFWLDKKYLTGRLLIGLSTILIGAVLIQQQNILQPKLSYSTYMDCFTGTCLTIMFISLIETIIVHGLTKENTTNESEVCNTNGSIQNDHGKITAVKEWLYKKISCGTHTIDVGARIIIPLVYLIFCIIYFTSAGGYQDSDVSVSEKHTV